MYALVDCNNFYASCERLFRPELIGRPVVVLSNNDGCVIARSNEAKAVGIPMGAPAFQYEEIFAQHQVQVFSANFALYGDLSGRVMSILGEYSPETEIYSIDECFLKFSGFQLFDLARIGAEIKARIPAHVGIPICVGIAPTKALAKVANRIAKKYFERTDGCYLIDSEEKRIKALKWLKIEDVWGIGRQHAKRLNAIGVTTAYQFTQLNDAYIRKQMSVVGLRLKKDLSGIPTLDLEEIQAKQNIACTRSFESMYTTLVELKERVSTFAATCAEKLRKQGSCCGALMVFIHTNGFRADLAQYSRSTVLKLPYPTNSTLELVNFALIALDTIFKEGYQYKKAGVMVMDFSPENSLQVDLFNNSDARHRLLMKALDKINQAYGMQKIRLASQDQKRIWKMKQEKLSPRYTTNIKDIIKIKV